MGGEWEKDRVMCGGLGGEVMGDEMGLLGFCLENIGSLLLGSEKAMWDCYFDADTMRIKWWVGGM